VRRVFSIVDPFFLTFLSIVLITVVVYDIRVHKIPNFIVYPTIIGVLLYHFFTQGPDGVFMGVKGLALGIGLLVVPYLIGVMGAGDVKLMGAVGAALGARGVFITAVLTSIVGGIYALLVLVSNLRYTKTFISRHALTLKTFIFTGHFNPIPEEETEKTPKLYYALAIVLGTFIFIGLDLTGYDFVI
jgi:prepilin peptidase CpaA